MSGTDARSRGALTHPGALAALAVAAALMAGCALVPKGKSGDVLSLLGPNADSCLVFPVAENRELAALFASRVFGEDDPGPLMDRTKCVYAGFFPGATVRIAAEGNFPSAFSSLAFPSAQGWEKVKAKGSPVWYRKNGMDAVLPGRNIAALAWGPDADMAGFSSSLAKGRTDRAPPVPALFSEAALTDAQKGSISLFSGNTESWASMALGGGISLPVDYAVIRLEKISAGEPGLVYAVFVTVAASNERTAKAMARLVKIAFPVSAQTVTGSIVSVTGLTVTGEQLVDFAENLYFIQ